MKVRNLLAGAAAAAVASTATSLLAVAPASADPAYGAPDANDIVGVGSDTTENVLDFLSNGNNGVSGYNAGKTAADPLLASWDTVGTNPISLRAGSTAINRPVGSGAGKAMLYGAGNNPDVTFARSSSALNATEVGNGLQAFPFALDTLGVAVDGAGSHAPASLTIAQILDIYKGTITDWSQVGGQAGAIHAYLPQSGSGTRSFFDAQLVAANGGQTVTYAASVNQQMHENTDDVLKADPDAVAPFSFGKQALLFPTTVKIVGGWSAQRALYNVVRGGDLGNPVIQGIFGTSGFVCSTAARPLVEAAGFKQLATPAHGGVCGAATQAPTSNFALNAQQSTGTTVTVGSTAGKAATIVARVTAPSAPDGTVSFFEGTTQLASGVPLVSGQATYTKTGATPGAHTYTAVFNPTPTSQFDGSQGSGAGYVKAFAKISETFPSKVAAHKHAKGKIKVVLNGVTDKATGKVKIYQGKKLLKKVKLTGGKAKVKLPVLKKQKNKLKIVWKGDAHGAAKNKKFTIKLTK